MVWSGQWVADRLGVGLNGASGEASGGAKLRDLLGLALRRNPKRAHLLVSNVLGKHVPQRPWTVYAAGLGLGRRVRELLGDDAAARAVVLGYAETATGLGHSVADGLALAPYLHSTRRPVPGVRAVGGFEEEHSHATSHLLLPQDPELLSGRGPLVLVDDEFSTGNTVLNTIAALHARYPRDRYVVVALVDMRSAADRARLERFAADLGARVDLISLAAGTVTLPDGVLERGRRLVTEHETATHEAVAPDATTHEAAANESATDDAAAHEDAAHEVATAAAAVPGHGVGQAVCRVDLGWPEGLPDGGRHGFTPAHRARLEAALPDMAARIADALGRGLGAGTPAAGGSPAPHLPTAPTTGGSAARQEPGRLNPHQDRGLGQSSARGDSRTSDAVGRGPGETEPAAGATLCPGRPATADPHPGAEPEPYPAPEPYAAAPETYAGLETGLPPGLAAAVSCPGPEPEPCAHPEADADSRPAGELRRVLVLGFEELMYAPLRLAEALQDRLDGVDVRYSTTTRSPVLAVDDPGYAIRTRLAFPAHDDPADGPGERYAYNVAPGSDPARRFDAIVAVVDSAADTPHLHAPDGLTARLAAHTGQVLLAVVPSYVPAPAPGAPGDTDPASRTIPTSHSIPTSHITPASRTETEQAPPMPEPLRGPDFSSYAPEEVGWLLQDFSDVTLEAPTEEREEAIQSGGAHYAESLPVEYQPSEAYQALFRTALDASATRIARAVGTVTDTVLAERSPRPVLVSLARAGTPVGVLMRRWARHAHGVDLPHYAVSIVRGRGIDTAALRWLAAHHDPADIVFVDGWTGKGAITRELAAAVAEHPGFDPRIAVLADPGRCVDTYGTRDDFLIPSACLNSTVSGLVSRTVLRADLVGPGDFHGAKFYRELAGADVSGLFLDTVAARFADVEADVAADVKELAGADRTPTWEGWAAVERISEEYGIHDVNLVKPGVGETTRVLLRRVPWKILASRGAGADLDHVRLLAEQRGVPVEEVDELPYTCVGLIHPRFTRGATGADGKAVSR
ncbi:phosphoribosyltransferase domain-containing protein [Streptomyces sp. XD-27]|uniref:phosphoribosyltransferase domain-containing protein n=1 Tax=Streptomyces sp. XD-27 TaxID=3062779 RepID=UPI0026F44AE4|nr:phosphoribosyltransferase domain-containing protein [Streptomyces sp. XD-27]WKX74200.1 phosphoribosyltransferase domain-containing protein [Streptomyces sp. XD-27]